MEYITNAQWIRDHSRGLIESYYRATGKQLIDHAWSEQNRANALLNASFVLLSHGTEEDPILNYGNNAALELWEMTWDEFTRTASRLTAEPILRSQREKLLEDVRRNGYADGYSGVRISKSGKRFEVRNLLLWNVVDEAGIYRGQAAVFSEWRYI